MAVMRNVYQIFGILLVLSFAGWLFFYDAAAEPGSLSFFHEDIEDCTACHQPWKGVSDKQCLRCHEFESSGNQREEIRFHEARKNCLVCHKEHQMLGASISAMDHRILRDELLCTACHFDQHDRLFGDDCRECHGIRSWKVAGYKHPGEGRRDCYMCHRGPQSHYESRFWHLILEDMVQKDISPEDCWRCHGIYHWEHLKMEHQISPSREKEKQV